MATSDESTSDDLREKHHNLVVEAIVEFQLLEERLKNYIHATYRLVDEWLDQSVPFGYSKTEIDNAPLGKLVRQFRYFCTHESLLSTLASLVPDRNYVAHRGFLAFDAYLEIPREQYVEEIDRIEKIVSQLQSTKLSWWMVSQQYAALDSAAYGGDEVEAQTSALREIRELADQAHSTHDADMDYMLQRSALHECLKKIRRRALEKDGDPIEFGEGPCGL